MRIDVRTCGRTDGQTIDERKTAKGNREGNRGEVKKRFLSACENPQTDLCLSCGQKARQKETGSG